MWLLLARIALPRLTFKEPYGKAIDATVSDDQNPIVTEMLASQALYKS